MISTVNEAEFKNSRKNVLMAELKHLEWYKMANASALKAALKQAKSLKNIDAKSTVLYTKNATMSTAQTEKVKCKFNFYRNTIKYFFLFIV